MKELDIDTFPKWLTNQSIHFLLEFHFKSFVRLWITYITAALYEK